MQRSLWRQYPLMSVVLAGCAAFIALVATVAQRDQPATWAAVVLFFWGAAVLAALAQAIIHRQDPMNRYLSHHRPLAGPRAGAELPG